MNYSTYKIITNIAKVCGDKPGDALRKVQELKLQYSKYLNQLSRQNKFHRKQVLENYIQYDNYKA